MKSLAIYRAAIFFLVLLHCPLFAGDRMPPEERDRLRRIVSTKQTKLTDAEEMKKAVEIAAQSGAFDVLEAAINNPDPAIPGMYALEALPKSQLTPTEKRQILLAALLNPSIWPKTLFPSNIRAGREEAGRMGAVATRDMFFREAILDAFGRHIEEGDLNWGTSQDARIALAKEIGGPEVVAALSSPDGATRVRVPKVHGAEIQGKEDGGPINGVAGIADAAAPTPQFGRWALWTGIAAVPAAAAGWLLFRLKRKKR